MSVHPEMMYMADSRGLSAIYVQMGLSVVAKL